MTIAFNAGQILSAGQLNTLAPTLAIKASNQTVTNSATLVNDTDIVFTLSANQTAHVAIYLGVTATTTVPGIKVAYVLTGTVALTARTGMGPAGAAASTSTAMHAFMFNSTAAAAYTADTGTAVVWETLVLTGGASGGTVQLQWAQNAATAATTTTVTSGSHAILRYVA